ncbi:MAG TPA: hypothetical protein PKL31_12460 [Fulvivirga sp.]|nr:hypothetical protein [Fulvivirga sp.]
MIKELRLSTTNSVKHKKVSGWLSLKSSTASKKQSGQDTRIPGKRRPYGRKDYSG